MQTDLNCIIDYAENLQLALSRSKCSVMSFSKSPIKNFVYKINDHVLEHQESCKDLGFLFDKSCKPLRHLNLNLNLFSLNNFVQPKHRFYENTGTNR